MCSFGRDTQGRGGYEVIAADMLVVQQWRSTVLLALALVLELG